MVLLLLLFINYWCSHCLCFFCVWSLFYYAVLNDHSSVACISLRKRELVALRHLSVCCIVTISVLCLLLMVSWDGLRFVLSVLPGYTHLNTHLLLLKNDKLASLRAVQGVQIRITSEYNQQIK